MSTLERILPSGARLRKLDGHDLGDGDDRCEVAGCDEQPTHALEHGRCPSGPGGGWVCDRHAELAAELEECDKCGSLTHGEPCNADHGGQR